MNIKRKVSSFSLIIGGSLSVLILALAFSVSLLYSMSFLEKSLAWINLNKKQEFSQETPQLLILNSNSLLALSNPSNPEPKVVKKMNVVATAYSSTVGQTDDTPFITASGKQVEWGIVANNYLDFGTKIRMPTLFGKEIFVVEDRMHYRKWSNHIDIWFPSKQQALNFAAKRIYIEVLEG